MCFVSADSTEKAKNQKNITLPQVIQLSIQISIHGVYFPGVLDYITIFKNSLHVFCFCKVVLQEQKHIQGFLGLTEMFYPSEFSTTDHFQNERPRQTYKRKLKIL